MKRITGIICLLCGLAAGAKAQEEAVGINTENPRGVLHIDAAINNPQTGSIDSLRMLDDVLVDTEGRLGAGVATPDAGAKVDLYAQTPGGALRIQDTTEGEGKVMVSDANGTGRWTALSGGVWWYAVLSTSAQLSIVASPIPPRTFINYEESASSGNSSEVNAQAGTITVPSDGKYLVTTTVWTIGVSVGHYWGMSALFVAGDVQPRWISSSWGYDRGSGTCPTYRAILDLEAGDVLSLALIQEEPFSAYRGQSRTFMVELIQKQ
jgi:hypothetical protein